MYRQTSICVPDSDDDDHARIYDRRGGYAGYSLYAKGTRQRCAHSCASQDYLQPQPLLPPLRRSPVAEVDPRNSEAVGAEEVAATYHKVATLHKEVEVVADVALYAYNQQRRPPQLLQRPRQTGRILCEQD